MATEWLFEESFGAGSGTGAGRLQLESHSGVAVNESTHDVYVADTANHRVSQFSSAGVFIRALGADVGGLGVNVLHVALLPLELPPALPVAAEEPMFGSRRAQPWTRPLGSPS